MAQRTVERHFIIPCFPEAVELTSEAPIVEHPLFQRLFAVRQLGTAERVFPGAQHSRAEHMLGAYHRTKVLARRLVDAGAIAKPEEFLLRAYALLHDVGHGPRSHAIEFVTQLDHKENGVRVLEAMRETIEAAGVPVSRLTALMRKQDPLAAVVSDYNLGTEKLDYLERDAYHIGKRVGDTTLLTRFLVFRDGELGIDHEVVEDAKRLIGDYAYMYKRVYLKRRCMRFERMLARMVGAQLEDGLSEDELWEMTDGELDGLLSRCQREDVRQTYGRFRSGAYPRTVIAVRPHGTEQYEPGREAARVVGVSPDLFPEKLAAKDAHRLCALLEKEIAMIVGCPAWTVTVLPPIDRARFRPRDIPVWHRGKRSSLRERDPHAFADIENTYDQYAGIRVCAYPEHAAQLAARRTDVASLCTQTLEDERARRG